MKNQTKVLVTSLLICVSLCSMGQTTTRQDSAQSSIPASENKNKAYHKLWLNADFQHFNAGSMNLLSRGGSVGFGNGSTGHIRFQLGFMEKKEYRLSGILGCGLTMMKSGEKTMFSLPAPPVVETFEMSFNITTGILFSYINQGNVAESFDVELSGLIWIYEMDEWNVGDSGFAAGTGTRFSFLFSPMYSGGFGGIRYSIGPFATFPIYTIVSKGKGGLLTTYGLRMILGLSIK